MGKLKTLFIKNRCEKIARHKKRRKKRKRKRKNNTLLFRKSQKTFEKANFYEKNKGNILTIPSNYSFIDNPDEAIDTLKKINYQFVKGNHDNIKMDYSRCEKLGLDASVLTDLIVLNGLKYRNKNKKTINLSGNQPQSYTAGEMFWNSGLLKHLKLTKIEDPSVERLDPFSVTMKDSNDATNQTIKYINNCLNRTGYELNSEGISYFNSLVGEIIGNSKEHSGSNGEWYVSGHFSQTMPGNYGKGSLCFISIGNTIYDNLMYNCKSEKTHEKIMDHLKYHRKLFNFNWNEELSVTVFGLQYKISSETDDEHVDRGTGTIKFIDSFANLGKTINGEKPKMAIISGKTHILFDGTYNLTETVVRGEKIQVIAFNEENDLKKRPNQKYVKLLKNFFPGVIISLEFYLDGAYFAKLKEVG